MDQRQLWAYFCDYAGYIKDAPKLRYAVRIGSRTLMSDDTADLWQKFNGYVRSLRKKGARK